MKVRDFLIVEWRVFNILVGGGRRWTVLIMLLIVCSE